jgi:hypothetical protein
MLECWTGGEICDAILRLPRGAPPIRTPAVAATDDARRASGRAAGTGRREARYGPPAAIRSSRMF